MIKNGNQARLEVGTFDVLGVAQESDTYVYQFLALSSGDDLWHVTSDELEIVNNILKEIFRETFEDIWLFGW